MDGEMRNIIKVCITVLASLFYCYFISSMIPKGKFRLLSLLPVISLFSFLPLCLSYLFPIAIAALFLTWLANFKLLLFAYDQGPLVISCEPDPPMSLMQFIFTACFPIKFKQNKNCPSSQSPQNSSSKPPILPLNWPMKALLFALLVGLHDHVNVHPNSVVMLVLYSCMTYLLVDVLFGVCNTLVRAILNMELEPSSDEPYFSTSLQDFWGRRWNLMVTNILRHTIYKPIRVSAAPLLGKWAPLLGLLAAFLVSGLMHELFFYYVTRVTPTWEVTCFFVLHGVCLAVEFGLKRMLSGRCRLHWAVSGPLTVGFVMATAMWLFFPPVIRSGAAANAIEECKMSMKFVKESTTYFTNIFHA